MVKEEQQHDDDFNHMQMIKFKGKRTKRQRLPSPLRLPMPPTSFDISEEEDMANCLILLAQGCHQQTQKAPELYHVTTPDHNSNKKPGLHLYECKTCNKCFPSFQALGGHRASHNKPKAITQDQKQGVTSFVHDRVDHYYDPTTASTTFTLQIPNNRALFGINTTKTTNKCNKVHECYICGTEFSSGQALGGHMRRHRSSLSTTSTSKTSLSGANNIGVGESPHESLDVKTPRNVLMLDLNLPAPEDDHRETKLLFQSKEKVIVFNATSLVDCHY
ncbi:unnamed protein product [Lupinus luteus]|uniref:C2H2-type domain-containing protein n=1 Tax=Lupinus luteus TaxID=3873 RepID=A0AAV1WKS5_LUPLU